MPAYLAPTFRWPSPTEEELQAVAKALNDAHKTCCVKGCTKERIGWEAVSGDPPWLRGIGFCPDHMPRIG